jgi:hypothetical protein
MCGANRNRIRADAEKASMAQTDLSRETHEQIEACNCKRENENECAYAIVVGRWKEQRHANKNRGNRDGRQQSDFGPATQA